MAKAIALYKGGVSSLTEIAIREDGTVFQRFQRQTRFGYQWSRWKKTGEQYGENCRNNLDKQVQRGFSILSLCTPEDANLNNRSSYNLKGELRIRLPEG